MHRSKIAATTAVLLAVGALAACGGGSSAAPKRKRAAVTTTTTTTLPPPPVAPETGLPDPSGQSFTRPALWVKVENLGAEGVRPQAGLTVADVVYEQVTEGDITRFITLFNSQIPDVVGPIRSTRAMDADVVQPLGGIFVYSGGIPESVAKISAAPGVNAVDESKAGGAVFRDNGKFAPHNLFGNGPSLLGLGGQPVPPPALFEYLPSTQKFAGEGVLSMNVGFTAPEYSVNWDYDAASNTWKRSMNGVPFTDTSGQQVAPTNVIVQFVGCCVDGFEGARYVTTGSGEAWVFSGGQLIKGTWSRPDTSQVTKFVDGAGQPIRLTPGKTWVEFAPNGSPVTVVPAPVPATLAPTTTTKAPTTTTKKKR